MGQGASQAPNGGLPQVGDEVITGPVVRPATGVAPTMPDHTLVPND
jgi:hypothetical protein